MNILQSACVGFASIVLFVFCDYTITRWAELTAQEGYWNWRLACVLLAAPLGVVTFGWVGARIGLAAVSGFVNAGIVAGGALAGLLLRREQLSMPQKIGLATAFVAIVLLNMSREAHTQ